MRIRWRSRQSYLLMFRNCLLRGPTKIILCVRFCRYHAYIGLSMLLMVLLWWNIGEVNDCGARSVVNTVCDDYFIKDAAGNLCTALCERQEFKSWVCDKFENGIKSFRHGSLVTKVSADYEVSWPRGSLQEGLSTKTFMLEVERFLKTELGLSNTDSFLSGLLKDADVNSDDKLNLGEAQNLWRLIHQPFFLVFSLFQDLSVFPSINGTCGGLSMWNHGPYLELGAGPLFDLSGLSWTLGLFSNNSYRWMLPAWSKRAKVMVGLLEVVSEFYDRSEGQFHLCNIDGLTLFHTKTFELALTESSLPLSGAQVSHALRNVSCRSWRDCTLTAQCQTQCDYRSRRCTAQLVKPTLTHACGLMKDYLLFDAPRFIRPSLGRLLRRCARLTWSAPDLDLQHSLLVQELRDILWGHIQHLTR
ncbi:hypothetical protein EGW08_005104 [Elysia chlorotica]|uniref:FAM69 protein-kinase domain-containing protein n=1 Tax=Elysia chlorotica TaxID=188477 RepID=A0A3S1BMJ0_ELYCH|nr:hypothetical protein EGW08_005104 [Elysia chlorotica]